MALHSRGLSSYLYIRNENDKERHSNDQIKALRYNITTKDTAYIRRTILFKTEPLKSIRKTNFQVTVYFVSS
jgi:hypothetical protein